MAPVKTIQRSPGPSSRAGSRPPSRASLLSSRQAQGQVPNPPPCSPIALCKEGQRQGLGIPNQIHSLSPAPKSTGTTHTHTHARTEVFRKLLALPAPAGAGQSCQSRICPAKAAFVLPSPLRLLLPSQGFVPSFRSNDWWRGGPQTSRLLPSPLLFLLVGFLSLHVVYSSPKHCHRVQGPELP